MTAALLDAADPFSSRPSEPPPRTPEDTPTRAAPSRHGPSSAPGRRSPRRPYRQLSEVGQWHARTHARRPTAGRFVRPELAELVPAGYQPVLNRAAALNRFQQLPSTAVLRSDSHATRWALWQALVDHLDNNTGLAIVGQAQLAQRASQYAGKPIARSTAGNHLRALAAENAISLEPGASKEALNSDRDRAPAYVILTPDDDQADQEEAPLTADQLAEVDRLAKQLDQMVAAPVDELGHLPERSAHTRKEEITHPRKDAHFPSSDTPPEATYGTSPRSVLGSPPTERPGPARREHPERYQPRTGPERAIAVAWISAIMGWATHRRRFAALTDKELRKITGSYFAAGWSPAAIVRAFKVRPDGSTWEGPLPTPDQRDAADQPRIRNLWAVLTHRLAAWRDPLGQPLDPPFPSQLPPRGRPRKPPTTPPPPPRPARSAQVEAELAAWRARNSQQRARKAADEAERQARLHAQWNPAPAGDADPDHNRPGRLIAVHLRADIARRHRH